MPTRCIAKKEIALIRAIKEILGGIEITNKVECPHCKKWVAYKNNCSVCKKKIPKNFIMGINFSILF